MAWTNWKLFDFRSWSGYVTDDATYGIAVPDLTLGSSGSGLTSQAAIYPTNLTKDGDNFDYGYTTTPGPGETRDRSSAGDVRLAGIHFAANNGSQQHKFRVNVSAGTYDISLALGDDSSTFADMYCRVLDDTTPRITLSNLDMSGLDKWFDATGVERTSRSDWVTNQATASANISSGILIVEFATPTTQTSNTAWAHLGIRKQAAGGSIQLMGQACL